MNLKIKRTCSANSCKSQTFRTLLVPVDLCMLLNNSETIPITTNSSNNVKPV